MMRVGMTEPKVADSGADLVGFDDLRPGNALCGLPSTRGCGAIRKRASRGVVGSEIPKKEA
jgi:hypothetical protein